MTKRSADILCDNIANIYIARAEDAEDYLFRARKLKSEFGSGLAVVYCWFYSIPQKWVRIEPEIFELAASLSSFNLETMMTVSDADLASMLRPIRFRNRIASQLKNFCRAINNEYCNWDEFANVLRSESILTVFRSVRKYRSTRVTFKNLAAMMMVVGDNDNMFVLDSHLARFLGLAVGESKRIRTDEVCFKDLLDALVQVTAIIRERRSQDVTLSRWSLAVWFDMSKTRSRDLLSESSLRRYRNGSEDG